MSKLSELSSSPGINFSFCSQSDTMAFPARYIHHLIIAQCAYRSHMVFIKNTSMSQLSINASSPCKHHSLITDGCCMIIPKSNFYYEHPL